MGRGLLRDLKHDVFQDISYFFMFVLDSLIHDCLKHNAFRTYIMSSCLSSTPLSMVASNIMPSGHKLFLRVYPWWPQTERFSGLKIRLRVYGAPFYSLIHENLKRNIFQDVKHVFVFIRYFCTQLAMTPSITSSRTCNVFVSSLLSTMTSNTTCSTTTSSCF